MKEQDRCKKLKRKHDKDVLDMLGNPADPVQVMSIEQFTALLCDQALMGVILCSACVSAQGMDGGLDKICTVIVGHVWEATRFHFTYG